TTTHPQPHHYPHSLHDALPIYFIQTPEKVVVINQGGPVIRHIYLNMTHAKDVKPSWYGESVGHYENGDTLVIDTIGISSKSFVEDRKSTRLNSSHGSISYAVFC